MIPAELCARDQWVLWKYEVRDGKRTKPLHQADGRYASTTNPRTWATYQAVSAVAEGFEGIGFVVTDDDPYTGIDLDHCITDGAIEPWALDIVRRFDSYTEVTPSGDGLRIWIRATK